MRLGVSRRSLLGQIDSAEFSDWMALEFLERATGRSADMQTALFLSMQANINRNTEARPTPFMPDDFLLQFDKKEIAESVQSEDEQIAVFKALARRTDPKKIEEANRNRESRRQARARKAGKK